VEELNLRNSYALIPYVAVGVMAAVSAWSACSAYLGKRKTKRAAEDCQTVEQTIFRSEALEQFWALRMLPNALAGEGMFKEHYIRGMLSTIRRIHADLLQLARQVQIGIPLTPAQREHRKHPVNPSCQLGGAGRPAMREQFGDVGRLVGRQSREDVFQIGVGIVPVELGRLDQAHDGSRALTGAQ